MDSYLGRTLLEVVMACLKALFPVRLEKLRRNQSVRMSNLQNKNRTWVPYIHKSLNMMIQELLMQ